MKWNMFFKKRDKKRKVGFSTVELAAVVTVGAIVLVGIIGAKSMITATNTILARIAGDNSVVGEIEDLALWMDAVSNDAFDVVPSDGASVTQWKDINPRNPSPNIFTANPNPPTYVEDGINGRPAIHFDAINEALRAPHSTSLSIIGDLTYFAVQSRDSLDGVGRVTISKWGNGGPYPYFITSNASGGTANVRYSRFDGSSAPDAAFASNIILQANTGYIINVIQSGTNAKLYRDGQLISDVTYSIVAGDNNHNVTIGNRNDGIAPLNGEIGEIIMFNRAINETEREAVTDYLKAKWGI